MTVRDVGVAIVVDAGGYVLTGSTCKLIVAPGSDPNAIGAGVELSPLAIASDGLTATYTTTANDFGESGPWQAQLEVTTPSGQRFTSPPGAFYVFPLL